MLDIFAQYANLIGTLISLAILVAIYFAFQFKIDLWWLNLWYSMPYIGAIARRSGDTTRYSRDQSWTMVERELCEDYSRLIKPLSPAALKRRLTYLSKAKDGGRKPFPGWMLAVLGVLVILEGLGFAYQLGGWMTGETGSENLQMILMIGLSLVLCVGLLFLTHKAGHQLGRSNLIRQCDREWRNDGQVGKLMVGPYKIDDDQSTDDHLPLYVQCINRVGDSGQYGMVIAAVIAIVLFAVLSTGMRMYHMTNEQTQETMQVAGNNGGANSGNPFAGAALNLPQDVLGPQAEADRKGLEASQSAKTIEGAFAFITLAVIFVMTQVVGIAAGYMWGFYGDHSKEAYKGTRGFKSYDDYLEYIDPVIQNAQSKLQTLQQQMSARRSNVPLALSNTFSDFMQEKKTAGDKTKTIILDTESTSAAPQAPMMRTETPVQPPVVTEITAAPSSPTQAPTIEQAIAQFDLLKSDQDAAKRYLLTLEPAFRLQVATLIKARKAADEEAKRKQQAEEEQALDGLF